MCRDGLRGLLPRLGKFVAAATARSFHGSISFWHVGVDVILHSDADSIIHISTAR
jgi:hypothetical protein